MRRLLIILFALAGVLPVPSGAQTHTARVAVLTPYPNQSAASLWRVFTDALGERGWVEGRNITFDIRETEGRPELFQRFAAELVALRPDLIIGVSTQGTQAARQQTDTIPIVMCSVGDPVAAGLVASLARPGGNITGPSAQLEDLQEKSLQLLKQVRPGIARVAVLWTPDNAGSRHSKEIEVAVAPRLGIALEPIPINTPDEIDSALTAIEHDHPDAAPHPGQGPLTEPLAGTRVEARELGLMPHCGHCLEGSRRVSLMESRPSETPSLVRLLTHSGCPDPMRLPIAGSRPAIDGWEASR